jgi:hypothetical protein
MHRDSITLRRSCSQPRASGSRPSPMQVTMEEHEANMEAHLTAFFTKLAN